jgi:hypothetical protein
MQQSHVQPIETACDSLPFTRLPSNRAIIGVHYISYPTQPINCTVPVNIKGPSATCDFRNERSRVRYCSEEYPHNSDVHFAIIIHITDTAHRLHTKLPEHSSSRESNSCSPDQELPIILLNLKFHCRVHKGPSLVPTLSQIEALHILSILSL